MFTGIIGPMGVVRGLSRETDRLVLEIAAPWDDLILGESIAVNGACLTVAAIDPGAFTVHIVATSLGRTTFGAIEVGRRVNLERALQLGDRLGGHLVQGHVDGVGTVVSVTTSGDTRLIEVTMPPDVAAVTIPLGSITVDGVSLTANALPTPHLVQLSLVPFTLEHTTLGQLMPGDAVHLEGDLIGKHVRHQAGVWQSKGDAG
ncbi:MAG TPA: riboflavin synthase [Gemmatimonadales bacterium]|nr:riboflavin synthase [Gemmatimonadales bacterium]